MESPGRDRWWPVLFRVQSINSRQIVQDIHPKKVATMLYTIALILIILWAIGFFNGTVLLGSAGLIHLLLVIAVIIILFNLISSVAKR